MQGITQLYEYVKSIGCSCTLQAPMNVHTTFRIGGPADILIQPDCEDSLCSVLKKCKELQIPVCIVGNGSNLLVSDDGIRGAVILIGSGLSKITLLDSTTIFCGAGAKLSALCKFALEHGISGFEPLYGIPGTVGGAVYMNAGAYGGEIKDVLVSAKHLTSDGVVGMYQGNELELSYRHSIYCDKDHVITSAVLRGTLTDKSEIQAKMDDFMSRRKDKQPLEYPSAGSIFKRPEGYFAAALIEECGLKGLTVGGAQVSKKHSGFIINIGNATAKDVKELIEKIKNEVMTQKQVDLTCEVRMIGV